MLIHNSAEKEKALWSPDQRLGCSQQALQRQVEHPFDFFSIKNSNYEGPFLAYQGMKWWSLLWLNKWIMECLCWTRETRFIQILAGDCRSGWYCGILFFSVALCGNVCISKSLQESYFGDVLIIQPYSPALEHAGANCFLMYSSCPPISSPCLWPVFNTTGCICWAKKKHFLHSHCCNRIQGLLGQHIPNPPT